ncbi:MAG: hypothetical protein GKR89_07410 [Candidatus Latescibacteria bacterium]|nr:hypothetical protein [Candidatus Latescibacterota bacterium]
MSERPKYSPTGAQAKAARLRRRMQAAVEHPYITHQGLGGVGEGSPGEAVGPEAAEPGDEGLDPCA